MAGRYTGSYLDRSNGWRAVTTLADTGQASLVGRIPKMSNRTRPRRRQPLWRRHGAPRRTQPCGSAWATRRDGDDRLRDERSLPLHLVHYDTPEGRQLQHCGVLTFAQIRQQDDFAVGKLKGVMMNV